MASRMFANGIKNLANANINFLSSVIKAILTKSSYNTTFNPDTHDFLNDVPSGDRADTQKVLISSPQINVSATADKVYFGDNLTTIQFLTVANNTKCGGIVVFRSATTETLSPVICYNQFSANVTADGGTVTVTIHANGLFEAAY